MITEENTLGFSVDEQVVQDFISGKRSSFSTDIDEDTYRELLENVDGNLLLNVEQLPDKFHGCYFYNGGKFPYFKKKTLENILLAGDRTRIVGRIVRCTYEPGIRFFFGENPGEPSREDPDGDSCIWKATYELEPAE